MHLQFGAQLASKPATTSESPAHHGFSTIDATTALKLTVPIPESTRIRIGPYLRGKSELQKVGRAEDFLTSQAATSQAEMFPPSQGLRLDIDAISQICGSVSIACWIGMLMLCYFQTWIGTGLASQNFFTCAAFGRTLANE